MPQYNDLHVERRLTDYSVRYKNANFVNEVLFPQVMVKMEADKILTYDKSQFNLYDTLRANGGESTQIDWDISDDNYFAEEHSLKDIVTDRDRRNADRPLQIDVDTLEIVQDGVMLKKEYDAAQKARAVASYTLGNTEALSGTSQWSDYSNSDPLADFKTMQTAIRKNSLKYPTDIVLPYDVAITLAYHPKILEIVKYTQQNLLQNLTGDLGDGMLPKVLFGMRVSVAGAMYNSNNPGQQSSLADVWGKDVIVAYTEKAPRLKSICFGKTFRTEKYVRKWREEARHGDWVEYNDIYDIKAIAYATGYLLQSAIA